jgi:hypothetical protein
LETFRCPTCLFMLSDPGASRCPSCHKKLRRRGRPIVLGDKKHFGTHAPTDIDLLLAERAERAQASFDKDPLVASVPAPPQAPAPLEARSTVEPPPVVAEPPVVAPPPVIAAPPVARESVERESDALPHTTIFEPSQFDPEMRQVLDSLYRKARSEPDDETA